MRILLVALGSALVLLAVAACGGGDQSSELKGVHWRWSGLREGEDATGLSPIPDPENYLLIVQQDGSFDAKADCKTLRGTYSLSGSELALEPGPTARAACGKDSLSDKYVQLLGKVATYEIYDEGALALGLENDAGHLYFYVSSG